MKTFFVIDVGNTSTKWGVASRHRILREFEFSTTVFTKRPAGRIFRLNLSSPPSGAIISCVVPDAMACVRAWLRNFHIRKPLVVSCKMDLGIGIRYPQPHKIGADRLVNSVAAVHLYGAPAVVVDFGTAVTFDIVSAKNEYLGGVIAPGLMAMTDYLHEQTALLPHISLAEPASVIGKSTVAAMRAGAVIGYRGLVRGILTAIRQKMRTRTSGRPRGDSPLHIIATGGYSSLIASRIPEIQYIDPQLTLHGLRVLYCRQVFRAEIPC